MPDVLYRQDGTTTRNFNKGEAEVPALFARIKDVFPWFQEGEHRAASEAYTHEVLQEEVMRTCVMISVAEEALGKRVATAHRLFGMESLTSMLYVTVLFDGEKPSWMHPEAFILGVTEHHEEYGKPVNPAMLGFKEYFFVVPPAAMAQFGLSLEGINSDTVFSALEVDGQVVAYRRYTNFAEGDTGVLANWQMLYVLHAKLARRMDLVRQMYGLPYIHELTEI
ncbi:hypothetical protein [Flavobacterium sp.]|jgi:hypothetical protein|uniref:hypothetical protein n=1 Tax=Flavobacterium sp. TaxID=239 RepID=UPI0037BE7160